MARRRDDAFPFEAVRDLLGVVRAMYGSKKRAGASRAELARIAKVGKELSESIELAVATHPGTVGQRAAWERAEQATRRVGDLIDSLTPAEPLVEAARVRVVGNAAFAPKKKRDER